MRNLVPDRLGIVRRAPLHVERLARRHRHFLALLGGDRPRELVGDVLQPAGKRTARSKKLLTVLLDSARKGYLEDCSEPIVAT